MANPSTARSKWPRRFLSDDEQDLVLSAIRAAEQRTSGEIRVHLEGRVPRRKAFSGDPYRRARNIFARLEMQDTADRNAVLFYLATRSKRFAVVGDSKLHEIVGEEFWSDIARVLDEAFRAGRFAEGLAVGIEQVGERLREHFPHRDDDVNELPDEISY